MPTRSRSRTTTRPGPGRLPRGRPPTHPGEMLLEEFVKPIGVTQMELARRLGVSYPRLNEVVKGRRGVTPDMALRLSRVVGMSADFWLGLQLDWDLWQAMNGPNAAEIRRLRPLVGDEDGGARPELAADEAACHCPHATQPRSVYLRKSYDFSKSRKNPHAERLRPARTPGIRRGAGDCAAAIPQQSDSAVPADFDRLVDEARRQAKRAGMTRTAVRKAVKSVKDRK